MVQGIAACDETMARVGFDSGSDSALFDMSYSNRSLTDTVSSSLLCRQLNRHYCEDAKTLRWWRFDLLPPCARRVWLANRGSVGVEPGLGIWVGSVGSGERFGR